MFDSKIRKELQGLQPRLSNWKQSMPSRALRFHAIRDDLDGQIRAGLKRLRIKANTVARLKHQVAQLEGLADCLANLADNAAQLEDELRQLTQQGVEEPELGTWHEEHCQQWSTMLRELTADCECQTSLFRNEGILERIETELRLHAKALYWIKEASTLLKKLGSNPHTARLEAELPHMWQRLREENTTPDWLTGIRILVEPLQQMIKQPPTSENSTKQVIHRGDKGILEAMRRNHWVKHNIQHLSPQTRRDNKALFEAQQSLAEENASLQAAAKQIAVRVEDLAPAIEKLSKGSETLTPEQTKFSIHYLRHKLTQRRQWFIEHCRTLLNDQIKKVDAAFAALREAGGPIPSSQAPTIATDADPAQAAQAIADAARLEYELMQRVQIVNQKIETKLDLADAYLSAQDTKGARSLLEEVLQQGNERQKQRAQELLQGLF